LLQLCKSLHDRRTKTNTFKPTLQPAVDLVEDLEHLWKVLKYQPQSVQGHHVMALNFLLGHQFHICKDYRYG
jgi:hypothetical protein